MTNPLIHLKKRHLAGQIGGMPAVCSSHPLVLETAMKRAKADNRPLLIEATANQVNQHGGYTGMTPAGFATFIRRMAKTIELPFDRIILGADHLGPHVWKHEPSRTAMSQAAELAFRCVTAGFGKIHLDTAAPCADDPPSILPIDMVAERAVTICRAAESAAKSSNAPHLPLYVIGNEVPPPGGGLTETSDLIVTRPTELFDALDVYEKAFRKSGLTSAWERVVAVVVQPGVEFGDRMIATYDRNRAAALSAAHDRLPGIMTYEIHAADYQTPDALQQMVQDHFTLIKAGPCLTFAFREAVYALTYIEDACPNILEKSHLREIMARLMADHPRHWQSHYISDSGEEIDFLKIYSFRDRIRYYWNIPDALAAYHAVIHNLSKPIPEALLRQFFPDLDPEIMSGRLAPKPNDMIEYRIEKALGVYFDLS